MLEVSAEVVQGVAVEEVVALEVEVKEKVQMAEEAKEAHTLLQ